MTIINRDNVTSFITKDGSTIREILAPVNSSLRRQSLAEAIVQPGQLTEAHYHPNTEELYYIIEGEAVMALGDDRSVMKKGDAVAIPAGMQHQIKNTGITPLIFLCCCVPAYTHEDTVLSDSLLE